jgi:hypothetical protein
VSSVAEQSFFLLLLSELGTMKLTVGKIYGGLLILENWRQTRFGKIQQSGLQVTIWIAAELRSMMHLTVLLSKRGNNHW